MEPGPRSSVLRVFWPDALSVHLASAMASRLLYGWRLAPSAPQNTATYVVIGSVDHGVDPAQAVEAMRRASQHALQLGVEQQVAVLGCWSPGAGAANPAGLDRLESCSCCLPREQRLQLAGLQRCRPSSGCQQRPGLLLLPSLRSCPPASRSHSSQVSGAGPPAFGPGPPADGPARRATHAAQRATQHQARPGRASRLWADRGAG
jgi:hypothetical protein